MPPCLCVRARWGPAGGGGGHSRQGHTFVVLQWAVVGACGGLCVLRAPAAGHGCPTTWLLRESVGRVTGSFLQPTTEPQRGARGMWSEVLLD